ncbi:MAG: hypothetical protein PHQ74_09920 [Crocinitomicaceae bacterium]|nr:hypothetical protein [Crocinitomicaceae bacterium]
MSYILLLIFPFIIFPISTIILLFLRDEDKARKRYLNIILIANNLLFYIPIIIWQVLSFSSIDTESEQMNNLFGLTYLILFPVCGLAHVTLLILKISFISKKYEN